MKTKSDSKFGIGIFAAFFTIAIIISSPVSVLVSVSVSVAAADTAKKPCWYEFGKIAKAKTRRALTDIEDRLKNNRFVTERSLRYYRIDFEGFGLALQNLPPNGVWMDWGAGQAIAIRDVAKDSPITQRFYAFGVRIPEEAHDAVIEATKKENFQYLTGKIEHMELSALPKANIITDYYGPFSYSTHLDQVLEKALAQLEVGGEMFMVYSPGRIRIQSGIFGRTDLASYLAKIKGIEVADFDGEIGSIHLRRTAEPLEVPKLKLRKIREGAPPHLVYEYVQ